MTPWDVIKTRNLEYHFNGTEFSVAGLQNGESIGSVTLTSPGEAASAASGTYAITASNPVGGTFNINNYQVTFVDGTLLVDPVSPFVLNSQETLDGFDRPMDYANSIRHLVIVTGSGEIILIVPTTEEQQNDEEEGADGVKGTIPFDLRFSGQQAAN
ncbi:MAG TPA: MBG domain-containing protein [Planctomicrobium sp.]|nr:MBG domain-containing protein [Planctomicrobium sp.]